MPVQCVELHASTLWHRVSHFFGWEDILKLFRLPREYHSAATMDNDTILILGGRDSQTAELVPGEAFACLMMSGAYNRDAFSRPPVDHQ